MMAPTPHLSPPGRAWVLGADIDTDALAPGQAMKHGMDVLARHCLNAVRPEFAATVQPGDILVAGPGFGIGSSREQAASVLVHLGVQAVVAPSFGGLYFRNAFNLGLLLLTCPEAGRIAEGEPVALDLRDPANLAVVRAHGERLRCDPIPDFLMTMVQSGGLMNQLLQRFGKLPTPKAPHG